MSIPQDPRDPAWGFPSLPEKITAFRPAQLKAIDEILWRFQFGAKYVVLDAPTGSGKTLVAEAARRLLDPARAPHGTRALYMCIDRGLQRQFQGDFEYAEMVMGRSNYPTYNYPDRFTLEERLSCEDCNFGPKRGEDNIRRCDYCPERKVCPYSVAKREALGAQLACVNTSYFLHEANGPGQFSDWPMVIADEGDRLESALMSYAEASISQRRLAEWGIRVPQDFLRGQPDPDQVVTWLEVVLKEVLRDMARLEQDPRTEESLSAQRRLRRLQNLAEQVDRMTESYPLGGWVVHAQSEESGVTFKPVRVDDVGPHLLWRHANKWLIMSATVLDAGRMLSDLGVRDSWAVVQMPSSFPVQNRPIKVTPVADVTAKNMDVAIPELARAIEHIQKLHPEENILAHTVSYRNANRLRQLLPPSDRHVWLESSEVREQVLEDFKSRRGMVLFAPALERGLDLPDDACRVVVICKVPYPDLGDPQVHARFNLLGGRDWYVDQTLRSLVQMCGRGVRHEKDWCVTYILDRQFERVYHRYRDRLPEWWREAVQ